MLRRQRLVVFFPAVLLSLCVQAAPLDAKLGLWETTMTVETSGNVMPKSVLDKMPPDKRAKIEAAMKARAASGPRSHTYKSCLKKEDLSTAAFGDPENKHCKYQFIAQTASKQEATFQCSGDEPRSGRLLVELTGRDKMQGSVEIATADGKVNSRMTGRWVGADCKGADD